MADAANDERALTPFLQKLFATEHRQDPYAIYRYFRKVAPAFRSELGVWILSEYADCAAVLRSPAWGNGDMQQRFRAQPVDSVLDKGFMRLDPPDHTRIRSLVSKAFTPRVVERVRPRIEQLCAELIETARKISASEGSVDLVNVFAYPLLLTVITELLGVPARDQDLFRVWSQAVARGLDPEFVMPAEEIQRRDAALSEFHGYFTDLANQRRAHPSDDLFSDLAAVEDGGDRLSADELVATCVLLLIAGHETTVGLIINGVVALLQNPDQLAIMRRANPPAGYIEEFLRYDAPVQFTARMALADVELAGQSVAAGEMALVLIASANRDAKVFSDPEQLNLAREGEQRSLSFGLGTHFCLGAPLARISAEVALSTLLRASPNLSLATDSVGYRPNLVLRCPRELEVHL